MVLSQTLLLLYIHNAKLQNNNNNNNNLDLYSVRIHQLLVLKAHYFITPAHQAHKSFLKPSQLPGEYTAQLQPFRRI